MGPRNPTTIQDGPVPSEYSDGPPPLFLVHDASGLVNTYYKLAPLGCRVYGLWDPKFDQDGIGGWQSIQQIAEAYVRLIRRVMIRGEIILGGWSFGGLIAVQMAHLLATSGQRLRSVKIILIDTVFPGCNLPGAEKTPAEEQHVPKLPGISDATREKLLTALMRATSIADRWHFPLWASRPVGCSVEDQEAVIILEASGVPVPPPVVLIRAKQMVPLAEDGSKCPLDRTRFLPQLGWEHMQPDFVTCVLETAGNHYTIFDDGDNIQHISSCIKKALAV
ncbi:thioesterase domain containing protein [Colletotrichum incanum]|uniref:Thioesterase domain containing protein n=1 Tax=Colletotrichum incanum TaxID=1573173 RepID=A0A167BCU4_COLIC|nr:thioesterase domain containing protein [Colletotrichum incanum]OHW95279.1 thioesterase domain containing protein [Colletotrichum incanum]